MEVSVGLGVLKRDGRGEKGRQNDARLDLEGIWVRFSPSVF